jgi:aryl-alcohol dehydrogenase-like predicted oxidoreductase
MEQPQYNMFTREKVEVEFSQIFKTVGLGTTIWSPLSSGVLTDKYIKEFPNDTRLSIEGLQWLKDRSLSEDKLNKVRELNNLAGDLGTSLAKLAIAWCLKNKNVSTVILGASKLDQFKETLTSGEIVEKITPEIEAKIESILENKPEQPMF